MGPPKYSELPKTFAGYAMCAALHYSYLSLNGYWLQVPSSTFILSHIEKILLIFSSYLYITVQDAYILSTNSFVTVHFLRKTIVVLMSMLRNTDSLPQG